MSLVKALVTIYPEFDWVVWKFNSPHRFWKSYKGEKDVNFLHQISKCLSISNLDEWYRVSIMDLCRSGARHFVKIRGGLLNLLSKTFPQHNWNKDKFLGQKKSSQWNLYKVVQQIFPPSIDIIEEYSFGLAGDYKAGNYMLRNFVHVWFFIFHHCFCFEKVSKSFHLKS